MKNVFGDDKLGKATTGLFHSATTNDTDQNFTSNLKSFFEFCNISLLDPQKAYLIDIARYIAWLGKRETTDVASV
jgi:predicted HicB family RNase H-like nuclease